jgi:hypothetical protein
VVVANLSASNACYLSALDSFFFCSRLLAIVRSNILSNTCLLQIKTVRIFVNNQVRCLCQKICTAERNGEKIQSTELATGPATGQDEARPEVLD